MRVHFNNLKLFQPSAERWTRVKRNTVKGVALLLGKVWMKKRKPDLRLLLPDPRMTANYQDIHALEQVESCKLIR